MKKLTLLCAGTALVMPTMAFAQSTGSVEAENESTIVVTGTRTSDVGGVQNPDTPKAKAVLTDEFIQRQTPGQTINDTINSLPGVSFQNNDPFGSAGGALTIRGFDNTRISETFDGVPLNDSGNYALFSNQMLDPELIEQVNVNLGSTDVDSPTAAASGSTVNYRTRNPFEEFHARIQGSYGVFENGDQPDGDFFRAFGVLDTGAFGPLDTRAFAAASMAANDAVYGRRGKIYKQQYNAKLYQPVGSGGDFVSVSGHYNQNRNNFFGSVALRTDRLAPDGFPQSRAARFYTIARCSVNQVRRTGLADVANTCGSTFDERFNPSNTGNIRVASRFSITDALTLTVDPSYQYVKANGGGTVVAQEARRDINPTGGNANCNTTANSATVNCQPGYWAGIPFFGRDINGDGDTLDTVRILAPSQTQTHRLGVIAGLRYDINDDHYVRLNYSWDRARHRQTGEVTTLRGNGEPNVTMAINAPLADVNGVNLQKRDRLSYAILHQVSAEYRGEFLDSRLTVQAGLRVPFMTRNLTNYCFTSSSTGFVECSGQNAAVDAAFAAANPTLQGPQNRRLKYNKILPNLGLVYDVTAQLSAFANFSKGLQVPGTDSLYNSFFFPLSNPAAHPIPETTMNFDGGLRYRAHNVVAQVSGWFTRFEDRLAQAFDPDTDRNIFRNLGTVDKYGVDASLSYQVIPELQFYVYGSYLKSKIKDDVISGECANLTTPGCTAIGQPIFAPTAGRRESGAPIYTFGGRIQGRLGPVELGIQAKRTGPRYVNDVNLPIILSNAQVYPAKTPAYTLVDIDVRIPLGFVGLNDDTFFQINATNIFDRLYVGSLGGGTLLNNTAPFVQIGAPRAITGTLVVGF